MKLWRSTAALVCLLPLAAVAGCGEEPGIERYTVPKQQRAARAAGRILAAMVPHASQAWFFKISGTDKTVAAVAKQFRQVVETVVFSDNGEPELSLPEGWTNEGGSGTRFTTVLIPAEPKALELTVLPLPYDGQDPDQYALSNVNRWRGQLGLAPIGTGELDSNIERLELENGAAFLVNFAGTLSDNPMPNAPFMSGARSPAAPRRATD